MAVKIRLMRIGTNRRPFYRVVAVDERRKRTGGYLELLGTYNPLTEPKEINLDQGKIDAWIKKGAIPSYGFLRIIGKAVPRAPRKAKKPARNASQSDAGGEKKEQSDVSSQSSTPEAKGQETEETQTSEEHTVETLPAEIQETAPIENSETPKAEIKTEEEK